MPRYFVRPETSWMESDDCPRPSNMTVDEHIPTDTGLLDKDGNIIWRAPNPMGFGRDEEWG